MAGAVTLLREKAVSGGPLRFEALGHYGKANAKSIATLRYPTRKVVTKEDRDENFRLRSARKTKKHSHAEHGNRGVHRKNFLEASATAAEQGACDRHCRRHRSRTSSGQVESVRKTSF